MPRKPIEQDPRFAELQAYVEQVDLSAEVKFSDLKMQVENLNRKIRWQKSEAIMHALKSGLSLYAVAKAAGIKSSHKRATLFEDCKKAIAEYYGGNN